MSTIYDIKFDNNIFSDGGEIPNITVHLDSSKIASVKQCEDLVQSLIDIYQSNFSIDNALFEVCVNGEKSIVPFKNFNRSDNITLKMNLEMVVNSDRRYVIPIVPAKFDGIGLSVERAIDRVERGLTEVDSCVKFHGFKKETNSEEIYVFRDDDGYVNISKYAINNGCAVLSINATFIFSKDKKEIHIYSLG